MGIEMAASIGAIIVHAAVTRGADPGELLQATGFDPATAADPDAHISLELETRLWTEAARLASDDALGLHAAELVQPGAFDALDYAIRTAPTLGVGLTRLVRYNRLVHDAAVYTVHQAGEIARVEHAFRAAGVEQCRHSAEFTLAAFVVIATQITGEPLRPLSVAFRTPASRRPETLEEHRRLFGVTPTFSMPVNAIELAASALQRPLLSADPALSRLVERHADALLAARPDPLESTSHRVRRVLSEMLAKEGASLAQVAERLHLSQRSLQRRLADEGTTFDTVLDDMRHGLALRYLAEPKLGIAEVAYLLGYSEPSPFHRAFKRWTGMTPSEFRARA